VVAKSVSTDMPRQCPRTAQGAGVAVKARPSRGSCELASARGCRRPLPRSASRSRGHRASCSLQRLVRPRRSPWPFALLGERAALGGHPAARLCGRRQAPASRSRCAGRLVAVSSKYSCAPFWSSRAGSHDADMRVGARLVDRRWSCSGPRPSRAVGAVPAPRVARPGAGVASAPAVGHATAGSSVCASSREGVQLS
jgi:hypothetical protein